MNEVVPESNKPKILFITAMWKRRRIEKVTFSHLSRLKDRVADRASLLFLAVGSEGAESKDVADRYGWDYLEHPNNPLGSKWNALWNKAITYDVDAIVIIGSDNIVPCDAIDSYLEFIKSRDQFMGMEGTYMLNPFDCDAISFDGYVRHRAGEPVGGGRAFSRELFKAIGSTPFGSELNKGLDGSFYKSMNKRVRRIRRRVLEPLSTSQVFELKSDVQMWGIEHFRRGRYNLYTEMTFGECLSLIGDLQTRRDIFLMAANGSPEVSNVNE